MEIVSENWYSVIWWLENVFLWLSERCLNLGSLTPGFSNCDSSTHSVKEWFLHLLNKYLTPSILSSTTNYRNKTKLLKSIKPWTKAMADASSTPTSRLRRLVGYATVPTTTTWAIIIHLDGQLDMDQQMYHKWVETNAWTGGLADGLNNSLNIRLLINKLVIRGVVDICPLGERVMGESRM